MNLFPTSRSAIVCALVFAAPLVLSACDDDSTAPPAPIAGIVDPDDLPGTPAQKPLAEDGIPLNGCTLGGSMTLQEHAGSKHFVEYSLDGGATVRSYLYTYRDLPDLQRDWDVLRNGNERCVGGMTGPPQGEYSLLKNLPATATGWDAIFRSDTDVTHSQRVWARRGTDSIVSVVVIRKVDLPGAEPSPTLPVNAADLTLKVAAE